MTEKTSAMYHADDKGNCGLHKSVALALPGAWRPHIRPRANTGREQMPRNKTSKTSALLEKKLLGLVNSPPLSWSETGATARPNLHGLLRYPAMMVPCMQGDIIDAVLAASGRTNKYHVLDPFVGSGTIMTESLVRGLDFTGIDINPLAALVCEAKAAIDRGADMEAAAQTVIQALRNDVIENIDVDFPGRDKWFGEESSICFSRLRRSIMQVKPLGARRVLWTVFAETVRLCSNSRTSTYKLHIRPDDDRVTADRVLTIFEANIRTMLHRVIAYRTLVDKIEGPRPRVRIICNDIRRTKLAHKDQAHQLMVTSPPYGDNQTTIPYGQFSYLALQWLPESDLPNGWDAGLLANTHSLDSASLGGTIVDAEAKEQAMRGISPNFDHFMAEADRLDKRRSVRKVASFMYDFLQALEHIRSTIPTSAHWVLTTGNRTASGIPVPFDGICRDIVDHLGGKSIASLRRRLPAKRMPSRNSQGEMITTETTLVAEFA